MSQIGYRYVLRDTDTATARDFCAETPNVPLHVNAKRHLPKGPKPVPLRTDTISTGVCLRSSEYIHRAQMHVPELKKGALKPGPV